jgi:TRAP-type C4-dicarboxylate transport system permease small subunit
MTTLSYWLNRLTNGLYAVSKWLLIGFGIAISFIVFLQVFFRFTLQIPLSWSEESARYLMVWMGMIGSAAAIRHARHIGVQIFVEKLPPALFRVFVPLTELAMILFLGILAKEGLNLAIRNYTQLSPAMSLPMFYPYLAIPVGATLMILELAAAILQFFFPSQAGKWRETSTSARIL